MRTEVPSASRLVVWLRPRSRRNRRAVEAGCPACPPGDLDRLGVGLLQREGRLFSMKEEGRDEPTGPSTLVCVSLAPRPSSLRASFDRPSNMRMRGWSA
jgi:hypothetical protein